MRAFVDGHTHKQFSFNLYRKTYTCKLVKQSPRMTPSDCAQWKMRNYFHWRHGQKDAWMEGKMNRKLSDPLNGDQMQKLLKRRKSTRTHDRHKTLEKTTASNENNQTQITAGIKKERRKKRETMASKDAKQPVWNRWNELCVRVCGAWSGKNSKFKKSNLPVWKEKIKQQVQERWASDDEWAKNENPKSDRSVPKTMRKRERERKSARSQEATEEEKNIIIKEIQDEKNKTRP